MGGSAEDTPPVCLSVSQSVIHIHNGVSFLGIDFFFFSFFFFYLFLSFFFVWEVVLCLRQHAIHALKDDARGLCNAGGDDSCMLATLSIVYSTLLYLSV